MSVQPSVSCCAQGLLGHIPYTGDQYLQFSGRMTGSGDFVFQTVWPNHQESKCNRLSPDGNCSKRLKDGGSNQFRERRMGKEGGRC